MIQRFVFGAVLVGLIGAVARGEDWPAYRGPSGMGVSTERGLPVTWGGSENANVQWKAELPGTAGKARLDHSQSSPIVWQDRIFVTNAVWPEGREQAEFPDQHVACYRLTDGALLWDALVPPGPWKLNDLRGGYAAPTPATDGRRVYVLFGSSTLAALDLAGAIVWSRRVEDWNDFDVCIASSPVLHDGRLYLLADRNGGKSTLTALIPATGDVVWRQKRTSRFSHTTPVFIRHEGRELMLIGGSGELEALDPASGERVWWCKAKGDVTSPVYADGLVYTDSGRGGQGVCVDPGGTGDVTETHLRWTGQRIPEGLSSPVAAGGCLYRLHNPGILRCVDWKTGEALYRERFEGISVSSSPIVTPDGRVYLASAGKTFVIAAGPKLEILAMNDLGEPHASSAAASQRRLILKGSKHLFCVGAR